jgi:hypothetical protein
MASIAQAITKAGLIQADAATAVSAAVRAIGLRSATVIVGANIIVSSVLPGADRPVLVVQAGGQVVQGIADLAVAAGQFVVTNVRF